MNRQSPLPADFQTALEEIERLRKQLLTTNEKWMKAVERRTLDNRANAGTIRALMETEKELRLQLKAIRSATAHCEFCPGVDKPHGPHES